MLVNLEPLRKQNNLTQDEVANHLSISRQTYSKIEKGGVELTLGQAVKLSDLLGVDMDYFLNTGVKTIETQKTDIAKYRQIIQFFIENGSSKGGKIPKTKLAKLCYLADFAWYYYNLESLTNLEYRKMPLGPVPDAFFRVIDEMENDEEISLNLDGKAHMYANITSPRFDKLSTEEISFLTKIATRWKDASTKEIVDFTHEQLPWAICDDMEVIPYGFITQEDPEHVY